MQRWLAKEYCNDHKGREKDKRRQRQRERERKLSVIVTDVAKMCQESESFEWIEIDSFGMKC